MQRSQLSSRGHSYHIFKELCDVLHHRVISSGSYGHSYHSDLYELRDVLHHSDEQRLLQEISRFQQ